MRTMLFTTSVVVLIGATFCCGVRAEPIEAGVATADITPPVPYRISGYFNERVATGVHDPLLAKAVVFKQGDRQVALIFCDVIGISPTMGVRARQLVSERTGIPVANIVVAGTHTHTGPLYFNAFREVYHRQAIAREGHDPLEKVDYCAKMAEGIAQAAADAQAALRPVALRAGTAQEPNLSFNRRYHMKDGSVRFNPGRKNPDIVRAAGPIDPEVGLLMLRDAEDQKPLASLTVFALHLDTTGGMLFSADFPYYLSESLRKRYGDAFVSLFGIGTCGDINHIDVTGEKHLKAESIGTQLAETVKAALDDLPPVEHPRLAMAREIVPAPVQKFTAEEVAWGKETMEKAIGGAKTPFLDWVKARKICDLQTRPKDILPLEIQAVRLGDDVALVTMPGEIFVELGLAIKQGSPFRTTLVIELANDYSGYTPTQEGFAQGGYEAVNSRVAPGGGEMMVEAALRLLGALK